jgi:hypothetical protein
MARFTLRVRINFKGSPFVGHTVALKAYSMVERLLFIEIGRSPGSKKLKG